MLAGRFGRILDEGGSREGFSIGSFLGLSVRISDMVVSVTSLILEPIGTHKKFDLDTSEAHGDLICFCIDLLYPKDVIFPPLVEERPSSHIKNH